MSGEKQTVNVRMNEELVERIADCLDDRGFTNRSEFIRSAVRDALQQEEPYTEQAVEDINAARQAYEEGQENDIDELLENAGLDPIESLEEEGTREAPILFNEEEDTWTDETDVTIVGLGGAGAQIVTQLHSEGLEKADTVVIDIDEDTLDDTVANTRLHVQLNDTDFDDDQVEKADQITHIMEQSSAEISEQLFGSTDLVFILSGIGGSAGTTLTPIISRAAKDAGAVVTTISTLPHTLEHERRIRAKDDIKQFEDASDTFVLLDAARFTEPETDLSPGQVFGRINDYLVLALRQMVENPEYRGRGQDSEDQAGLASFFRNGGYATLATGTASESDSLETVYETLYSRSLVSESPESVGSLMHLVQINPELVDDEAEITQLMQMLLEKPTDVSPTEVSINIVSDSNMDNAINITSIITELDLGPDDVIDESTSSDGESTESEGGIILKGDNTVDGAKTATSTQTQAAAGSPDPEPA